MLCLHSDYFPIQHYLAGCTRNNRDGECLLRGRKRTLGVLYEAKRALCGDHVVCP